MKPVLPNTPSNFKPAPKIASDTTFLSFDVESNGLHGAAFAVGAVLVRADSKLLDEFNGLAPIRGEVDSWVESNVTPALKNWQVQRYPNARAMRQAFWEWFLSHKQQTDWVLVDNSYPVEVRFLMQCQEDDIDHRYWDHPYPLLDVASLLIQVGVNPLTPKAKFVSDEMGDQPVSRHNPRSDAWVSALAAIKALKMSGQLKF